MKNFENEIIGRVHSIETCGTVDGPGIRYVLFLQGCPLKCKYCHNPDTWDFQGGFEKSASEILGEVKKYKAYMKFTGGGITVTGGEPLMQPDFVRELFRLCKGEGIHTALDTSGFAPTGIAESILEFTDLVLLDLKSYNPAVFERVTGAEIENTLNMFKLLEDRKIPVWVRFVLVPDLTDDLEDINRMGVFLRSMPNIERIDVLPFHKLGEYKWDMLGLDYELKDTLAPSNADVTRVSEILKNG